MVANKAEESSQKEYEMLEFSLTLFLIRGFATTTRFSTMQSGFIDALEKTKLVPWNIVLNPEDFLARICLRIEARDLFAAHIRAKDIVKEIESSRTGESCDYEFNIEYYEIALKNT